MDVDAVFHQQHHELFSIHQGDGARVRLSRFLDGSGTQSVYLYFCGIPKCEGLSTELHKRELIAIALDAGVEPGANGGLRCLFIRFQEPSFDDQLGDFSGMKRLACLSIAELWALILVTPPWPSGGHPWYRNKTGYRSSSPYHRTGQQAADGRKPASREPRRLFQLRSRQW